MGNPQPDEDPDQGVVVLANQPPGERCDTLQANGIKAIDALFARSFGS